MNERSDTRPGPSKDPKATPMDRLWAASAVTLAALPTGSLVFVLAQQYGVYTQRATAAILVSTVLSVVTLFALFALLGIG